MSGFTSPLLEDRLKGVSVDPAHHPALAAFWQQHRGPSRESVPRRGRGVSDEEHRLSRDRDAQAFAFHAAASTLQMRKDANHRNVLIPVGEGRYTVIHEPKLVAVNQQKCSSEAGYSDHFNFLIVETVI